MNLVEELLNDVVSNAPESDVIVLDGATMHIVKGSDTTAFTLVEHETNNTIRGEFSLDSNNKVVLK